jgi:hypothetical protein
VSSFSISHVGRDTQKSIEKCSLEASSVATLLMLVASDGSDERLMNVDANDVLLVKIEGPGAGIPGNTRYTIYHHLPVVKGVCSNPSINLWLMPVLRNLSRCTSKKVLGTPRRCCVPRSMRLKNQRLPAPDISSDLHV